MKSLELLKIGKERLAEIPSGNKDALELLNVGGRICVITFHSLEDKICKNIFKSVISIDEGLKKLPVIPEEYLPKLETFEISSTEAI